MFSVKTFFTAYFNSQRLILINHLLRKLTAFTAAIAPLPANGLSTTWRAPPLNGVALSGAFSSAGARAALAGGACLGAV